MANHYPLPQKGLTEPITQFQYDYRWLSNFTASTIAYHGYYFPTAEHFYQAYKAKDEKDFHHVRCAKSASSAKRIGQKITLRPDWEDIKLQVMRTGLEIKFQIPMFKRLLLATGNRQLIEGNNWGDTYWGVSGGVGENHLGKLLMQIRTNLEPNNDEG